ncbi:hypothetical protein YC2023_063032 [Brassica napus]
MSSYSSAASLCPWIKNGGEHEENGDKDTLRRCLLQNLILCFTERSDEICVGEVGVSDRGKISTVKSVRNDDVSSVYSCPGPTVVVQTRDRVLSGFNTQTVAFGLGRQSKSACEFPGGQRESNPGPYWGRSSLETTRLTPLVEALDVVKYAREMLSAFVVDAPPLQQPPSQPNKHHLPPHLLSSSHYYLTFFYFFILAFSLLSYLQRES